MADFRALPLWTDSYLADTAHLTDAEHGRYLLLLMLIWRSPQCRVPNDDVWLAKRFRRSVEEFRADIRPLISEFCHNDGNWLTQKRLVKEFESTARYSQKMRDLAKRRKNQDIDPSNACNAPVRSDPIKSLDFLSDDGSTIVREEQIEAWERDHPFVKNIRGRLRHGFRSWLRDIEPEDRIAKFERYLANEQAKLAKAEVDPSTGKKYRTVGEFGRRSVADRVADGTYAAFRHLDRNGGSGGKH